MTIQNSKSKKLNTKNQRPNTKYQTGAALLITMLIIATVGALALAVGRIVISELRITTSYADSIIAYQAAESGIEQGLLNFRNNRNINNTTTAPIILGSAIADLKISYKEPGDTPTNRTLKKDEIIELDVSGNANSTITFTRTDGNRGGIIEYSLLGGSDNTWKIITSGANISIIDDKFFRIRYLTESPNAPQQITFTLSTTKPIDTGITKIESTGTYNNTKRKLVATIDRNSGQLIGIFDYTLYAGEGDIK